jgi:hypothetical protein
VKVIKEFKIKNRVLLGQGRPLALGTVPNLIPNPQLPAYQVTVAYPSALQLFEFDFSCSSKLSVSCSSKFPKVVGVSINFKKGSSSPCDFY